MCSTYRVSFKGLKQVTNDLKLSKQSIEKFKTVRCFDVTVRLKMRSDMRTYMLTSQPIVNETVFIYLLVTLKIEAMIKRHHCMKNS